ncbi:MAG: DUF2953 domain-containing protein [Negativicutes bacterium]|nr:DUF2953 domain-containing protein [Negativicutes bacterium]
MENWLAVVLATVVVVYTLSRVKIFIRVVYHRKAADDFVRLEVYLLSRLLAYHTTIPLVKLTENHGLPWLETGLKSGRRGVKTSSGREQRFAAKTVDIYLHQPVKWRDMMREVNFIYRLYRRFAGQIKKAMLCEKFTWRTGCGFDDAALTGLATGLLWALKSQLLLFLKRRLNFAVRPVIAVRPVYTAAVVEVEFECIFTIRVGNVINAAWGLLHFPVKGVKGSG